MVDLICPSTFVFLAAVLALILFVLLPMGVRPQAITSRWVALRPAPLTPLRDAGLAPMPMWA
jgi:hypothetical protein